MSVWQRGHKSFPLPLIFIVYFILFHFYFFPAGRLKDVFISQIFLRIYFGVSKSLQSSPKACVYWLQSVGCKIIWKKQNKLTFSVYMKIPLMNDIDGNSILNTAVLTDCWSVSDLSHQSSSKPLPSLLLI